MEKKKLGKSQFTWIEEKKVNSLGWRKSLEKRSIHKKSQFVKKIKAPPLPSEHRGWNAGKGDYGHYRSHLGFSVLMGRGFIEVGGWSREEPGDP